MRSADDCQHAATGDGRFGGAVAIDIGTVASDPAPRRILQAGYRALRDLYYSTQRHYRTVRWRRKARIGVGNVPFRRVLGLNMQTLGDVTLCLPAFRHLQDYCAAQPGGRLMLAVRPAWREWVASRVPDALVCGLEAADLARGEGRHWLAEFAPDLLVDFDPSHNTAGARLARAHPAVWSVGCAASGKAGCYDEVGAVPVRHASPKISASYLALARRAVGPGAGPAGSAPVSIPPRLTGRPVEVFVHVGASHLHRRWDVTHFTTITGRLAREFGARIHLAGGVREEPVVRRLERELDVHQPVVHLGLTVAELGRAIARCDYFLGNNSGPLHMAAELGVRTISVAGPSSDIWDHDQEAWHLVLRARLACTGCEDTRSCVIRRSCLTGLSAQLAWPAIAGFVARQERADI